MKIRYLGHSCFLLKTKSANVLIDPYDPKVTGLKLSPQQADVLLISHEHADHNYRTAAKGEYFEINGPGEYQVKDVVVVGIPVKHDTKDGAERGFVTMYLIRVEGVKILFCADLGHGLDSETVDAVNGVDILLVPVGGVYTIDAKGAVEVVKAIDPRIIIPMHYQTQDLKLSQKLASVEDFVKLVNLKPEEEGGELNIDKSKLPEEAQKLVILPKMN